MAEFPVGSSSNVEQYQTSHEESVTLPTIRSVVDNLEINFASFVWIQLLVMDFKFHPFCSILSLTQYSQLTWLLRRCHVPSQTAQAWTEVAPSLTGFSKNDGAWRPNSLERTNLKMTPFLNLRPDLTSTQNQRCTNSLKTKNRTWDH